MLTSPSASSRSSSTTSMRIAVVNVADLGYIQFSAYEAMGFVAILELFAVSHPKSMRQQLDHDGNVATVCIPAGHTAERPTGDDVGLPMRLVLDSPRAH